MERKINKRGDSSKNSTQCEMATQTKATYVREPGVYINSGSANLSSQENELIVTKAHQRQDAVRNN